MLYVIRCIITDEGEQEKPASFDSSAEGGTGRQGMNRLTCLSLKAWKDL